jgi:ABC-2 type transport system ATP-binding protein
MLQGRMYGLRRPELQRRVSELLELLGLAGDADRLVRGYSGGMRRRLDIALGVVHRPAVLLLDEPTTGLDPEARAAMWTEFGRLAQVEALTVLLTTHYLEEADRLADRLVILSSGKVVVEGAPEALKREFHDDAVTVQLVDGRADDGATAIRLVRGIHDVTVDRSSLRARVRDAGSALPSILSALEEQEIAVVSATVTGPSLADVYFHYSGRDFHREDKAE